MSRRIRSTAWIAAALLPAAVAVGVARGADEPEVPKVPIEKIASLIPGTPLGPWDEAGKRPIALVIWPEKGAADGALATVETIAATYSKIGVGAQMLLVNGPGGVLPTATVERKAAKALAVLAGRDAKKDFRHRGDLPLPLVRGADGSFTSRGPLDLEHEGYNLVRGLKEVLDVRFTRLDPLDKISITDLGGKPVELRAYLDALPTDVALLDLWGTWCPPCQRSLPHLVRLSETYRNRATVVGVTCEAGETLEERRESLDTFQKTRTQIPYPLLFGDLWGLRLKVTEFLGYPTMLVLRRSPDGWRILSQHVGFEPGDDEKIEQAVRSALDRG